MNWNYCFCFISNFSSINLGFILKESSISTKTGVAPAKSIAETVGTAVFATVITSSPLPISRAFKERNIASVPLATQFHVLLQDNLQNFFQIQPGFLQV